MHILTGILLAGLMGRGKGRPKSNAKQMLARSPLLRAPSVISITHAIPGRTRFRIPTLISNPAAANTLCSALVDLDPIQSVEANRVSGSVLIHHDADHVPPDVLAAVLVRLLGLEQALTRDVDASLSKECRALAHAANRAVYERCGGLIDLKSVLFLTLGAIGLRKILKQRTMAFPAGFTLLWWAANGLLRGRQTLS